MLTISLLSVCSIWIISAETLKIGPGSMFPQFTQTPAISTLSTTQHIHPIFDLGDLNGDGRVDIVIFEMDGPDVPLPGAHPAHNVAATFLQEGDGLFRRLDRSQILPTISVPRSFILADFDEDRRLDLLLNDRGEGLMFLRGNGDGTFGVPSNLDLNAVAFPVSADFNRDGHLDFAAATRENAAMVHLGAGNGSFSSGAVLDTITSPSLPLSGQIMTGDINRDNYIDIAVASVRDPNTSLGNLDVFLGRGDGTFEQAIRNVNAPVWRGTLADFNGDGLLDYAGDRYSPEQIEIWLCVGNGRFTRRATYSMTGYYPGALSSADVNSDGIADLISANTTNQDRPAPLGIFLGKGDGTFQPRRLQPIFDNMGQTAFSPVSIDINSDGLIDILSVAVSSNYVTNTLTVLHNAGSKIDSSAGFQLTVQDVSSRPVIIMSSTDFANWSPLATNTAAFPWSILDTRRDSAHRFYRAVIP